MDDALSCVICFERYNLTDHLPKTLKCGHTFCITCLQSCFNTNGRLQCSIDNELYYDKVHELPDNEVLKSILQTRKVHCPKHSEVVIQEFCIAHIVEICTHCAHEREDCVRKSIAEDTQEIITSLHSRIDELRARIPESSLSAELREGLSKRYTKGLVFLLQQLHALERTQALACQTCGQVADYALNPSTMEGFCSACTTPSGELISLEGLLMSEVTQQMMYWASALLFARNFYEVPSKLLQGLQRKVELFPKDIQESCWNLQSHRTPRGTFESLPDSVCCPMCLQSFSKQKLSMRVLPCVQGLHAICEACKSLQIEGYVMCPLDNMTYAISTEKLDVLGPRQSTRHPSAASQTRDLPDTPLPAPYSGYCYLDRFPSVLPQLGTPVASQTGNNRGWSLNFQKNQVEVFSFVVPESVYLVGITLATPVNAGVVVLVQSITIYLGTRGCGKPAFSQLTDTQLVGSCDAVSADVFLQNPFRIMPATQYTLKINLRPAPGATESYANVYRGSPYKRPEVWIGNDGVLWEFAEVRDVEPGEFVSGQGNFSGPVLRFYYTRA